MERASRSASALQTIGAVPLVLVIWSIVSTLASAIWFFMNNVLTLIRPEVLGFFSNIIGGIFGVVAAGFATEKWLPCSSGKAVAVAFYLLGVTIIATEWLFLRSVGHPIVVSAGAVATIWTAHHVFWRA
jgi:hypothetical protein